MKRDAKKERALARLRGAAGKAREAHFAAGGDLAGWRGLHVVQRDRKREAARKACRIRVDKASGSL